ncbi:MAG: ATP-binding protein [Bacilli bacterium]|nr:ATP-binding protein [Bacilli bacterium]
MKLLKVKVPNGYLMLKPGTEINFLTKTRINKDVDNTDLIELEPNFYYPLETVFIGKNSSGKSTTMRLIFIATYILDHGRVRSTDVDADDFDIEITFYGNDKNIYLYKGSFKKDLTSGSEYLKIVFESLERTIMKESYNKDLSNASYTNISAFKPSIGSDTSMVARVDEIKGFNAPINLFAYKYSSSAFAEIYRFLNLNTNNRVFEKLIRLFDDSIESISPRYENNKFIGYYFKRTGEDMVLVDYRTLDRILSEGTIRGLILFSTSIIAFNLGGHIMVDEIEAHFNKNLVENLIIMFNDEKINKKGASLIYSTHYAEILDENKRLDNINVLHRNGTSISIENLSKDYDVSTELLKSKQFDQNAFDNLINYKRLMELKDELRK